MPFYPPLSLQLQPSNPTATASATYVMMGLGAQNPAAVLTPQGSTRLLVILSGDIGSNTTADGATVQLSVGTGAAPANGAAVTGTQFGAQPTFTALTGVLSVPFSLQAIATGLTQGTQVWVDVALKAVTGGSASLTNLSLTVFEI